MRDVAIILIGGLVLIFGIVLPISFWYVILGLALIFFGAFFTMERT